MTGLTRWLPTATMLLCGAFACGDRSANEAAERRARVHTTLASHLHHEEALLTLLERFQDQPDQAIVHVTDYVSRHEDALEALCAKRRLLETEPAALAEALGSLHARSTATFARRQRLYDNAPTLMARPEIKRALSTLDDL